MIMKKFCLHAGVLALALSVSSPVILDADSYGAESSRQSLRSPANPGGPEAWPENEALSTTGDGPTGMPLPERYLPDATDVVGQPESTETRVSEEGSEVTGASSHGLSGLAMGQKEKAPEAAPEREVIYMDEAGNPVPKPLEPDKMMAEATAFMEQGKFDDALPILEQLKGLPGIAREMRENVLYAISDCLWARYADNPLAGYEPIVAATNEALNANLRGKHVPDALLRLGLANVNVDNLDEASGYIVALMRRFPDYPGVANGLTALGKAQLKKGDNARAEQSFGIVLDKYPESSQLQDASVGLARALVNQGKDERAMTILEFISKRWPRYYINDQEFLLMQAGHDEKMNRKDQAMDLYWLYVNLDPKRQGNDKLLLKMGDEYMKGGNPDAANFVYEEVKGNFPDSPAAVTADLRLAEKGIYDSPINYDEMSKVFDKTEKPGLWRVYNEVADSSSTLPDAVLTKLKRAMWLYWDKQYPEAMGKAADFIDNYPENQDTAAAKDLLWDAFNKELDQSMQEKNYGRILLLWNGFPYVRERYGDLDPRLRYALAQGWLERGDEDKSLDLLSDFLRKPMDPNFGEAAFSQFFNNYLKDGAWDKILDLGNQVRNWKMRPELQNQLEYAEALSAQNLNLGAPALNRWKDLAGKTDIPLYQRAYATYFLTKDAERRRDIRNAYEGNRKVIELFSQLSDERSDKADPERIKESIASLMDICEVGNRIPEALEWVNRYNAYVPRESPEYPGLRFREARLFRKLGDANKSQALLEDVAKNFPSSPFSQAAAAELRTFDVSRDLQKYMTGMPEQPKQESKGTTAGNWSSTAPGK